MKKIFLVFLGLFTSVLAVKASPISFPDVKPSDWFHGDVMNMVEWGVIKGNDDGTFKPGDNVNRAELSAMWNRYDDRIDELDKIDELLEKYDDLEDSINFAFYVYGQNIKTMQLVLDAGLYSSTSEANYSTCFILQTTDIEIQSTYDYITSSTFENLISGDYYWVKDLADDLMERFYTEDDCNEIW